MLQGVPSLYRGPKITINRRAGGEDAISQHASKTRPSITLCAGVNFLEISVLAENQQRRTWDAGEDGEDEVALQRPSNR